MGPEGVPGGGLPEAVWPPELSLDRHGGDGVTWDQAMALAITRNRMAGWKAWRVRAGMLGLFWVEPIGPWKGSPK